MKRVNSCDIFMRITRDETLASGILKEEAKKKYKKYNFIYFVIHVRGKSSMECSTKDKTRERGEKSRQKLQD